MQVKKEDIAQRKSSNTVQPLPLDHARRDHQSEAASEHPRRAAAEPKYGASHRMQKAFSVEETPPF